MRILVIDQCSKAKNTPEWFTPFDADTLDESSREELLTGGNVPTHSARALYTGRQQQHVSEAVDRLREAGDEVNRVFISAGFGVVDETTALPPYNVTFNDYPPLELDERAEYLNIREDIVELVSTDPKFDVIFFILGSDYYRSIDITSVLDSIPDQTIAVLFNQEDVASEYENVISLSARTEEAKEFGTIVVALKGIFLKNFAEHRSNGAEVTSTDDISRYCMQAFTSQTDLDQFDD